MSRRGCEGLVEEADVALGALSIIYIDTTVDIEAGHLEAGLVPVEVSVAQVPAVQPDQLPAGVAARSEVGL